MEIFVHVLIIFFFVCFQNLQDELEDLTEQSSEIQEIMGRSYGMPEIDDDELEAELDALGDEIGLDEDASYLDDAVSAPSVPSSEPGAESVRVGPRVWLFFSCCFKFSWEKDQNRFTIKFSYKHD